MYRFRAIILNITRIRDNNTRIVMMSREYWKITWWWSKKNITGIDLWDIVEVMISRENSKNTIKNLDLITPGWNRNWNYTQIHYFLKTLQVINQISREGYEQKTLYDDSYYLIRYWIKNILDQSHYIIFQMRILKSLGSMNPEIFSDDPTLRYIYNNISIASLEKVLSAKIKIIHLNTIEQVNLTSLYSLA